MHCKSLETSMRVSSLLMMFHWKRSSTTVCRLIPPMKHPLNPSKQNFNFSFTILIVKTTTRTLKRKINSSLWRSKEKRQTMCNFYTHNSFSWWRDEPEHFFIFFLPWKGSSWGWFCLIANDNDSLDFFFSLSVFKDFNDIEVIKRSLKSSYE